MCMCVLYLYTYIYIYIHTYNKTCWAWAWHPLRAASREQPHEVSGGHCQRLPPDTLKIH